MFALVRTKAFERDVRHYLAKGGSAKRLEDALGHLCKEATLSPWLRDHPLHGKLRGCRELHVEPDWLLVYEKDGKRLRIVCLWLVTHQKLRERERGM